jgi:putative SOS response-associated peptidase YedK
MTLTVPDLNEVAEELEARLDPQDAALYRPRFNAAPTDQHWMVRLASGARLLLPARWGFAGSTGLLINARAESADALPAFREAFRSGRVVVPADGFFEWTGPSDDRRPIWFRPRAGGLLYLAGLEELGPDGKPRFVVLTTEAAGPVAEIHDRMPALLRREEIGTWLARPDPGLLVPRSDLLAGTEVTSRVNSVANDDPACIEPAIARAQQLRLF